VREPLPTPPKEGSAEDFIGHISPIGLISLIVLSSKENKQHKLRTPSSEGVKEAQKLT
jgi:hypothetical protein